MSAEGSLQNLFGAGVRVRASRLIPIAAGGRKNQVPFWARCPFRRHRGAASSQIIMSAAFYLANTVTIKQNITRVGNQSNFTPIRIDWIVKVSFQKFNLEKVGPGPGRLELSKGMSR